MNFIGVSEFVQKIETCTLYYSKTIFCQLVKYTIFLTVDENIGNICWYEC